MNATEYQKLAARTLIDGPGFEIPDNNMMIIWNAVGLAGEAGEVCESVKKGIFHQHGLDLEKMKKELGDCLWYIAALCSKLDLDLSEVMAANIEKLKARYPNGYSSADSVARADTKAETRPLNWDFAEAYLAEMLIAYQEAPNSEGADIVENVIKPLAIRYVAGERSAELYEAILKVS